MISIIVPVYNVENYLKPCLDSILKSTYRNFELILVDDGSTDSSGLICDQFSIQDSRIRVIHKQNGGVSDARNVGLEHARGEFVTFVDGDDVIHPLMLEILLRTLVSGDFDLSIVGVCLVSSSDCRDCLSTTINDKLEPHLLTLEDYEYNVSNDKNGQFTGPCAKLFKKSLIDGLWFKPLASEDAEWNVRLTQRIRKAILLDQMLYFYVMSDDSLTRASRGMNRTIVDRLMTHLSCLEEIPEDRNKFRSMWIYSLYERMLYTRYKAYNTSYSDEVRDHCSKIYNQTIKEFLQGNTKLVNKLKIILYYYCPFFYKIVVDYSEKCAKKVSN